MTCRRRFLVLLIVGVVLVPSAVGKAQKPTPQSDSDLQFYVLKSIRDPAHAQEESLRGLKGIYVIVAPVKSDAVADGLTARQLQTDTELRLRQAGITVPTADEYGALPLAERVSLVIEVDSVKSTVTPTYAVCVTVKLTQLSRLARNNTVADSVTWQNGFVSVVGAGKLSEGVRSDTRDVVDEFSNAYLSVNPR